MNRIRLLNNFLEFTNLEEKPCLMKRNLLMIILTLIVFSSIAQEKQTDYTEAFKLIEVWLDAQRDYDRVPGMSVIIVDDQDVIWSAAFGMANLDEQVKATPSTLYSICSISKLFTSIAIMKLYDEGKLRLDDDIHDLLPWFDLKQQYTDSWPISIRTLLTHSSGLPRESDHPYWTGPDFPFPDREAMRSELHNQETLYPSSTYFQYSNLGLTLLGEVVEEVSGVPYESFIRQNILDPLEMNDTRTYLPEELYGRALAVGYSALKRDGTREKVNFFQAEGIRPAAGFSSSVTDFGKFASWQFRLLDTTASEILRPSTLKYMYNVHWTDPDWSTTWGLGFIVFKGENGEKMVEHGGSCPGYNTLFRMIPGKKRAYAVFTNGNNTDRPGYIKGMHGLLEKYKNEVNKQNGEEEGPDLEQYAGYYGMMPWQSEVYLGSWHNQLVMLSLPNTDPAGSMVKLRYIGKDTFRRVRDDGELGETFEFERNETGTVRKIKRHNNYFTRISK